jgi:hypothetical protein
LSEIKGYYPVDRVDRATYSCCTNNYLRERPNTACSSTGWIGAIFQADSVSSAFPVYRTCTHSSLRLMLTVGPRFSLLCYIKALALLV